MKNSNVLDENSNNLGKIQYRKRKLQEKEADKNIMGFPRGSQPVDNYDWVEGEWEDFWDKYE